MHLLLSGLSFQTDSSHKLEKVAGKTKTPVEETLPTHKKQNEITNQPQIFTLNKKIKKIP